MRLTYALASLLVVGSASARFHGLLQNSNHIESLLQKDSDLIATLTRRQAANPVDNEPRISTTPFSGDARMADFPAWNAATKAACDTAMAALNGQASNPTGLGVCYNLPYLNNRTGVFLAEVRTYPLSQPVDIWAGLNPTDFKLALSYRGADTQDVTDTLPEKTPMVHMFVGRINSNLMGTAMTQFVYHISAFYHTKY
ncbi:hypothetical protein M011DRAFT_470540 [Sporormia fimetaria CBS 119925]|uniref:Uncharacterized protein n=1 Tax=Sporormia fimetaria CBS 119925 TaxID=1340428 RepID=A0A6A6V520_9PLEO|nr:hypothetical protein M011DRAFT_470540 [Sporormia fimetaria CBS 119925]